MTLLVNFICIVFSSFYCFLRALCPTLRLHLFFCCTSSHSKPQIENRIQMCWLDTVYHGCTTVTLIPGHFSFVLLKLCTNLNFLFCNHIFLLPLHFLPRRHFGIPAMRCLTHGPLTSCLTRWLGSWWFLPDVSQAGSTNLSKCSSSSGRGTKTPVCVFYYKVHPPVLSALLLETPPPHFESPAGNGLGAMANAIQG